LHTRNLKSPRRKMFTAFLGALLLFACRSGIAQNAQGSLLGHVVDPSGAAVTGAKVTVKNLNTGVTNTYVTTKSGDYLVSQLDPGTYSVSISVKGFQSEISSGLIVEVDHPLRQDFKLLVGSATSETVTVLADAQMLQTDNATIGEVMEGKLIDELPTNGRDVTNLLQIGSGVTITPGGSGGDWSYHGLNTSYTEVSINGAHADSISYTIDGVYDADFFFSAPINVPNQLAVEEFKVMNGQYGAQYGQGSAQVNVAIKSGTNQIHGAAYDFFRDAWIEPTNQYDVAQGNSGKPPFHQNQFGGTVGGPLVIPHLYNGKDKTFWFASYDVGRYAATQTATPLIVPSTAELGGDFSAWPFPIYDPATTVTNPAYNSNEAESGTNSPVIRTAFANNQIPTSRFDSTVKNMLTYFNAVNVSGCSDTGIVEGTCENYIGTTLRTKKSDVETVRLDHNFGKGDHLFTTVNVANLAQVSPSVHFGQGGTTYDRARLIGLTWSHPINANLLNQATLGYSRDHFFTGTTTAYGANLSQEAGFANTAVDPATYDLPSLTFQGIQYESMGGGEPTTYFDNIYQGVDTMTLIHGRHTWSFGLDFRRVNLKELDNYDGTGTLNFTGEYTALAPGLAGSAYYSSGANTASAPYEGNSFADFLLGDTQSASGPPPLGTDNYTLWGNNWNLFVQDDYRFNDRLTLNLGLRWERPTSLHNNDDSGYTFNPNNGGQLVWANGAFTSLLRGQGANANYLGCCVSNTLVQIDKKDFAPRLGFSYRPDLLGDKLVVRGGYGIFYDTYNRYYDGSQYDKDSLYTQIAAPYTSTTGDETQSTAVVKNLWSTPLTATSGFSLPSYEFPFNQVNWPKNHNPYNQQWSLDTQYAITPSLMFDAAYVGSHGVHEATQIYIGGATPPTVAGDSCNNLADKSLATGTDAYCLSDANFQPIDTRTPYANMPPYLYANGNFLGSSYNALQLQLIERVKNGLQYHINYSYSKSMDVTSGINLISGEPGIVQDHFHPQLQRGFAASDQTHRLVASYSYELPAGNGHFLNVHGLNWLLGGWTSSGIYQLSSGFPFSINGDAAADQMQEYASGIYLANYTGTKTAGFKRTLSQYIDPAKYSQPELGRYGTTNKSPERTPFVTNLDATLGKTTKITESESLRIRAEWFNLADTWHSSEGQNPGFNLFPDSGVSDSNFGSIVNRTYGNVSLWNGHTLQLSAQYNF
jgi:hypothetical protein